ncbi:MAG: glucose 1-dehydrogenase [Acidobacteria bacterium]|nr:glucose 1-dehydrogenase [Acidobacteriota bacterium]
MGRLEGKNALVTGGGSGIGRAAARLFAREGARVAVVGRRRGPLDETARAIREEGGEAVAIPADLSRPVEVLRAMRRVDRELGTLQVLFNNHGIFESGSVESTPERQWDRIVDVNLKAVYLTSRAAIPRLRRQGGSIINNASTLGLVGLRDAAAYCAAKGGVVQLTRAMALDHAGDRIRVNAICPGVVDTPMWQSRRDAWGRPLKRKEFDELHPVGRMGTPEDVAALAVYLASDESSWMTGSILTLDGGLTAS